MSVTGFRGKKKLFGLQLVDLENSMVPNMTCKKMARNKYSSHTHSRVLAPEVVNEILITITWLGKM